MRIRIYAIMLLALLFGVAGAGADAPRIACDEAEYDFGERDEHETVSHEFTLRNVGSAPLVINRVKASCGCTVATLSNKVIEPGGRAQVRASLNLKGRKGPQRKSITVESNDPSNPRFLLWLKGKSQVEFALEPGYVNFGAVDAEAVVSREVHLTSRYPDVALLSVSSDSDAFAAALNTAKGVKDRLIVHTVPPLRPGSLRGTVTVRVGREGAPVLKLPVLAMVQGEVQVLPQEIVLPGRRPGKVKRTIIIRPGSVSNCKVLSVEPPVDGVRVGVSETAPGTYRIDLHELPVTSEMNGKQVRIKTNLKQMAEIVVPIKVFF